MQDRSSSMVGGSPSAPTPESWSRASASLTALVNDPASAGLAVGLGAFPPLQGVADCTTGANCGAPLVAIGTLPGNAAAMIAGMEAAMPAASPVLLTPTECGVRGIASQCAAYTRATGIPCAGVLVTDGTPTECNRDDQVLASILTLAREQGVKTFVVGLPGSDVTALNALAAAGGTERAVPVPASTRPYTEALAAIRTQVRAPRCRQ